MTDGIIIGSHALAALLFGALALWAARLEGAGRARWVAAVAFGAIGVWALAVAALGPSDVATFSAESVRALAMFALMFVLHRRAPGGASAASVPVYAALALTTIVAIGLHAVAVTMVNTADAAAFLAVAVSIRMMVSVAALVVAWSLFVTVDRIDVRLTLSGLAVIWCAGLNLWTASYAAGEPLAPMVAVRGIALIFAAGLIALGLLGGSRGRVRLSRAVAYQGLWAAAFAGFVMLLVMIASLIGDLGGAHARILQTVFIIGATTAAVTVASSPWVRAWIRVKVAKHLFGHRYDYRVEWLRFTATLGAREGAAPLSERALRALADLTESPAAQLLIAEGEGLGVADGWNWDGRHAEPADAAFTRHLLEGERIVELDPLRRGVGDAAERAVTPAWMLAEDDGWAVVPLIHDARLVGAILLARPTIDRALDWEDFDLLKVAGRQVASYLAEARANEALAEAQRFDEFNRRFAFIVHDIKNLVSGLSLVARNAERHADNPDFRADMVATLQDSAAKLNALLSRLSAAPRTRGDHSGPVALLPIAQRVVAARRAGHPVSVAGSPDVTAHVDAARLETILAHLVQNAIEASSEGIPVSVTVEPGDETVAIAVSDGGSGMTASFIRDQLFRPFASSKPGGFGIGAFEARQLAESMGGRIEVASRPGAGSVFRVVLPVHIPLMTSVAA